VPEVRPASAGCPAGPGGRGRDDPRSSLCEHQPAGRCLRVANPGCLQTV